MKIIYIYIDNNYTDSLVAKGVNLTVGYKQSFIAFSCFIFTQSMDIDLT